MQGVFCLLSANLLFQAVKLTHPLILPHATASQDDMFFLLSLFYGAAGIIIYLWWYVFYYAEEFLGLLKNYPQNLNRGQSVRDAYYDLVSSSVAFFFGLVCYLQTNVLHFQGRAFNWGHVQIYLETYLFILLLLSTITYIFTLGCRNFLPHIRRVF